VFRRRERDAVHELDVLRRLQRRSFERLRWFMARGSNVREVFVALKNLAANFEPIVEEGRLKLEDDRPGDAVVRVSPMLRRLGVSGPLVRDADAPGKSDLAVDHQDLAVGTVLDVEDLFPAKRIEPPNLVIEVDVDTGVFHLL
jgi:hypothetical protein